MKPQGTKARLTRLHGLNSQVEKSVDMGWLSLPDEQSQLSPAPV